jgi:DtxR family transcriptional regulator, Mn-dependent transcriptional regulator
MTTDTDRILEAVADGTSESEEMYLITVARAVEDGHVGPVPVPVVADALEHSRVSANEMAKKLVARGFLEYEPYKGVTLTPAGTAVANRILRRRRLWALFLAEHLGLTPAAADTVACEFEHVTPAAVADRLSGFLGDPTRDPEGKPIPAAGDSAPASPPESPLTELTTGQKAAIVRVVGSPATRSFLAEEGVGDGAEIRVAAIGSDRGYLIETPRGHVHLTPEIAGSVMVQRLG